MSELKTRFVDDTYAEYYNTGKHELAQIYLKSEADKVIAEKDKEIEKLKEERCWRKFSEESPKEEDDYYLVFDKYGYMDTDRWRKDKLGVWGFSVHGETVRYFMPLPSAPKEANK